MQLEAPLDVIEKDCGCLGSPPQLPGRAPCDDDDDDVLVMGTPPPNRRRLQDDGVLCAPRGNAESDGRGPNLHDWVQSLKTKHRLR